jgi:two-component sensor histidine kinase
MSSGSSADAGSALFSQEPEPQPGLFGVPGSSFVKRDRELDFEAVFNSLAAPYLVLNADLEIVAINQAYLDMTKRARDSLVGARLFTAFPAEGEARRVLEDSFERVREKGVVDVVPVVPYSMPVEGGFEPRFWSCTHVPIRGSDGTVTFIVKSSHDITELKQAKDLAPRSIGVPCASQPVEGSETVQVLNQSLLATVQHLRALFMQAPNFMFVLRGPDHVFEMANLAFQDLTGGRELLGKTLLEGLPEAADQDYLGILRKVYQTAEPYVGRKMSVVLHGEEDGRLEEHFIDFVCQPIVCEGGEVSGVFVEGSDVTDHVRAEQRQALLIRELHHRVRNTLATVQGVMNTTAKSSVSVEDFQIAFAGRIASLANTHAVLTDELEQSVSFCRLLNQELGPYRDEAGHRVRLKGSAIDLPSQIAVPLGMAVHELTTNAARHGALASETGHVVVEWRLVDRNGARALLCEWSEHDGPEVRPPSTDGFGAMMLTRVLSQQIGADVDVAFDPGGFRMRMVVPLELKR